MVDAWINEDSRWIVSALLWGLGILLLAGAVRSGNYVRHYGLRNFFRSTFQVEPETWRIIGVLLLLVMACAMMSSQWI
jgi:hypothetical protein